MSADLRWAFDANVLVSAALFSQSKPGIALSLAIQRGRILISDALIEELDDVLRRPRFDRYLTLDERELFLAALIRRAQLVLITETIQACRDPGDDYVLELAINGNAAAIVTGDRDLLALHPFRGVPILAPDELLTQYAS